MCRAPPGARAVAQGPEQTVQGRQARETQPQESWPLLGIVKDPGAGCLQPEDALGKLLTEISEERAQHLHISHGL